MKHPKGAFKQHVTTLNEDELRGIIARSAAVARPDSKGRLVISEASSQAALDVSLRWRVERFGEVEGRASYRAFLENLARVHLGEAKTWTDD